MCILQEPRAGAENVENTVAIIPQVAAEPKGTGALISYVSTSPSKLTRQGIHWA
jgi:hypothetical protein